MNRTRSNAILLGNDLYLDRQKGRIRQAFLYRHGSCIKTVDLSDNVAKRLFVVEVVALGAQQNRVAEALGISRQTIHNYRESHKHFGVEGLVHGYNPEVSQNQSEQRAAHAEQLLRGNKAAQAAALRAAQREQAVSLPRGLNFSFGQHDPSEAIANGAQPFAEQHAWEASRYAGLFVYWIPLIFQSGWLQLILGHFGAGWRIFSVFLLMAGLDIGSIEQIKHVRSREAGVVLGLGAVPSKSTLWAWFYGVAHQGLARRVLDDYFRWQIRAGLVSCWLWFTDGHLLPYTGKENVHYSYNTQRRLTGTGADQSGHV